MCYRVCRIRLARAAITLVELLVVLTIIGGLAALLIPSVMKARESARRMHCANNMRQLGLGLHQFHDTFRVFPASGWTEPGPGNPDGQFVGWRPLILPYLEKSSVYAQYDFTMHWWEGSNIQTASIALPVFRCPSVPSQPSVVAATDHPPRPGMVFSLPLASTDYEALMGVKPDSIDPTRYNNSNRFSIMHRNSRKSFRDVADGTTNTIAVVECSARPDVYRLRKRIASLENDQGICWADSEGPFSLDLSSSDGSLEGCLPVNGCTYAMNRRNDNEPFSFHASGLNAIFVDGSLDFIAESVDAYTFAALATASGGEIIVKE
ncbi:DUF1559 domain-containing protein [Bremerella sp. JC770]|uniref:DUF1559 family PulG-like putative transporter n=1 Tax=Bremerella sp. JC770 TaxID=3232137 RepID=UPI00345847FC